MIDLFIKIYYLCSV